MLGTSCLTKGAMNGTYAKLVQAAMKSPIGINGVAHRLDHHRASGLVRPGRPPSSAASAGWRL